MRQHALKRLEDTVTDTHRPSEFTEFSKRHSPSTFHMQSRCREDFSECAPSRPGSWRQASPLLPRDWVVYNIYNSARANARSPHGRDSSLTTERVLLLQNVFPYYRTCSLTTECVLFLQNVFSYYRMCSLTTECVLLLQNVFYTAHAPTQDHRTAETVPFRLLSSDHVPYHPQAGEQGKNKKIKIKK